MRRQTAPQNVPQINVMQAEQRAPLLKINDLKNTKSDECLRTNLFKANNQKNTSFEQ